MVTYKLSLPLLLFLVLLVVTGCQSLNPSTTPNPTESVDASGYPVPQPVEDTRGYPAPTAVWSKQTAFQSYPIALEAAKKWNPQSDLYEIPATVLMELNFGRPITGEGWYFMFKVPDSTLEYYVYVSDGKVSGSNEAQPIIFGTPPYEFQPLPSLTTMWDSDRVLQLYEQNNGKKYLSENPKAILNCELSYLKEEFFSHLENLRCY